MATVSTAGRKIIDAEQLIAEKNLGVRIVMLAVEEHTNYNDLPPEQQNIVRHTIRYRFHHLLNVLLIAAGHSPKEIRRDVSKTQRDTVHA